MKKMRWFAALLIFLSPILVSGGAQAATSALYSQARSLFEKEDYLGLRIFVKNSYVKKMTLGEWFAMKNLIMTSADRIGYDLIPYWNARNTRTTTEIDQKLAEVDKLTMSGRYEEAFSIAQGVAQKLRAMRPHRWDASWQLPYVYHAMGRALYGAGRYEESLKVYQWIGAKYPYFVQVLFEKMWAAFKAGRVDLALGAVASQRSAYFSKYLPPESYLLQTYLYRRLCRDEDQKQVIGEMKAYQAVLEDPHSELPIVNDVNTLVLFKLTTVEPKSSDNLTVATEAARTKEQTDIKAALKNAVESRRKKTLTDLKAVIAYQQLSTQVDTKAVLQPVHKMTSRDDLLKQNLEIWPADSAEEWMDELGKHVLTGESLCNQQK